MQQEIYDNYESAKHPTAFSGINNLKTFYQRRYGVRPILNTLQHIDAYTHHREYHKPRHTNPFYIYRKREQVQMDLIDVSKLKRENGGVTFILLAIDTFTKYAWARPLKTKSAVTTLAALKSIVEEMGQKPEMIFFDRGTEFTNEKVATYLQQQQIKKMHPSSEKKAAIVERCNRTIQGILYRFLAHYQTRVYVNRLQDMMDSYNRRVHRTIHMTPTEAETDVKQDQLLQAHTDRYTQIAQLRKRPRFSIGDKVLVANISRNSFHRGYEQTFNFEQFEIVEISTNMPVPMYFLKSLNDEQLIEGGFYAEELQKIQGDVFKIDKVLKRRRHRGVNQVFVSWRGYDDRHNQWINASELVADYRGDNTDTNTD